MAPRTGYFVLHSNFMPPVTAGTYELQTEQLELPFDVEPGRTTVKVSSPRYSMPTDQVISSFPPANAVGAFADRLPQIVLKRRTLPWERNPFGESDPVETPWLALVVVAEAEAELSTPVPVVDCVTPGTDLLEPSDIDVDQGVYLAVTRTVVDAVFPTEDDLRYLTHVREVDVTDTELSGGDDDGWLAVVLANRLPVYDETNDVPVRYLACLVNVEGQLDVLPEPVPQPSFEFAYGAVQDWSVLATATDNADVWVAGGGKATQEFDFDLDRVAGADVDARADARARASADTDAADGARAAAAGASSAASSVVFNHGASLDGSAAQGKVPASTQWSTTASAAAATTAGIASAAKDPDAGYLVRNAMGTGFRYPIERFAPEPVYRFPVLAHWSFTTTGGDTFETLMQNLDVGLVGTEAEPPEPEFAGVEAPPRPPGPTVVASGHLAVDHHTRRGDTTSAWYRGPLVPHPTRRDALADGRVAHSSDQLRMVVPDGQEDLSYAAAFEIGRLLGLSQLSVVAALLRLRRDHFGAARVRRRLDRSLPFDIGDLLAEPRDDLGHLLSTRFVGQLGTDPTRFAGPRRPVADPGRPIPGLAGLSAARLDETVANGLGLDIDRLRGEAAKIGAAAVLAQTEVPVGRFDELPAGETLDLLRNSLEREVVRLANIAAPGGDGSSQADALDDLEDRLRGVAPPSGEREDDDPEEGG